MKGEVWKNAAVGTLVAAALATGIVALVPGDEPAPPPVPGPAARARAAAGAGAPASLADLGALIADRERWLVKHPRDEESWAVLGAAYTERGVRLAEWSAYPKAEKALRRSLEVLPGEQGNTEALLGLAALANARQDFLAARDFARLAQKQRPRRWTVYPVLIEAYGGLGDYKSVGRSLDSLQKLYAGSRVRAVSAQVYRDRGWREDAAAHAYDAVGAAQGPAEKASALWRLGELAWERGEPAEAVESYGQALRLAPDHHAVLASRGRALGALGRSDEAFRDYQAAMEKMPLPEYALEAGDLYASLGLEGDAVSRYETVRTAARDAAAHGVNVELVLGRYETDHGDPDEAVDRLRAEWDRGRHSVQMADALGWALFRAGRAKEALPFAKRATKEGPRRPVFAYHLGEIERALGLYGPARRHVAEALRTNPVFSPLLAPAARTALAALGEPPDGGPRKLTGREGEEEGGGGMRGGPGAGAGAPGAGVG
ncbi:tetratricopeptide repeat protein [Streptomyces sp. NPDC051018]|uniref:tetratricopeptide repeat protein n=1 Tax=Streptomyces sp. NPDC051018 TaxID=3365639 RepID=UPI0037BD8828